MRSTVSHARDRDRETGVDGQYLSGHPAGLIAAKIDRRPGDVPPIAFLPDEAARCPTLTILSVKPFGDQPRVHLPARTAVDADVLASTPARQHGRHYNT